MRQDEAELVLEAIRTARSEIEALEADADWYCTTGNLIEQLLEAEDIMESQIK